MAEPPGSARLDPAEERQASVGRLYDHHGASLYRYALMLLADPAAAEDAVQQVFAALLRPGATRRFENEVHYLRRAVRNECMSWLRTRHPGNVLGSTQLLEPSGGPDDPSPEERMALERALRALPVDQREVLHLHVFEGLSFREIAEQAGESINTVASRYRYALEKLRGTLGPDR